MANNSTFQRRYGALFNAVKQREEEQTAKAAVAKKQHEALLASYRAECEAEERTRMEQRIVENDGKLRDYQQKAVKEILSAWKTIKNIMLQMPTGTGKTRLFVALINALNTTEGENYGINGKPHFLIVTHREELTEQISETLTVHYRLEHQASPKPSNMGRELNTNIYIYSIQYLARHIGNDFSKHFDFIIIDEAHHSLADSYRKLWKAYPSAYILGVTATPYRLKGQGFTDLYDKLIENLTISQFIEQGYLADYRFFTVSGKIAALQKVNRLTRMSVGGDYQVKDLQEIYANSEEIQFLYNCYNEHARGKQGIIYAVNQLHAEMIARHFAMQGVSVANIDSKTSSARRKELIAQFRSGELQVLVNVELFGEGFDCPSIEFALLARPTKSLVMYLQQVGRALRPMLYANKESDSRVIILDCVGLYNRFGLPETRWDWKYFFEGRNGSKRKRLQKLGLDSDNDGMTEIDTPRVEALKNVVNEELEATLEMFCGANGLFGIRNKLNRIIVEPCCKELTKTKDDWFYGKDNKGNLLIYGNKGVLLFCNERCDMVINNNGTFFIRVLSPDNTANLIGPYNKHMCINERFLSLYKLWCPDSNSFHGGRYKQLYIQKDNDIAMTSYKLTLKTRLFRMMVKSRTGKAFLGLDNIIYTVSSSGTFIPHGLTSDEVETVIRKRAYWR